MSETADVASQVTPEPEKRQESLRLECPVCRETQPVKLSWKASGKRLALAATCVKCKTHVKFVKLEPPWIDNAPPRPVDGGGQGLLFGSETGQDPKDAKPVAGGDGS